MSKYDLITARQIMGMYFQRLEVDKGAGWLDKVSNLFGSDQASEEYAFLGMPPAMREWLGGRHAKSLSENSLIIQNKKYEATLDFLLDDMRRDKTKQIEVRIAEFTERSQTHFASLVSAAIAAGETTVCYDGQFYFDIDHQEGDSVVQSNDISTTIAGLPAAVHGSVTAPSPAEMQQTIMASITQMLTFVDDQNEPMNELAQEFLVMVPVGLYSATTSALSTLRESSNNTFDMDGFSISAVVNPRLTTAGWTDKFATFRTDAAIKALIRQEEYDTKLKVKDETSEYAFDNDAVQFGLDASRGAGVGRWQNAVLNTMV